MSYCRIQLTPYGHLQTMLIQSFTTASLCFFLTAPLCLGAVTHHGHHSLLSKREENLSPDYPLMFQVPLPIPPVKQPTRIVTVSSTPNSTFFSAKDPSNRNIQYYEVEIKSFQHTFFPGLGPADMVGYDGISPGPTIIMERGTESIVRFVNNGPARNSVHLHGSYSRAPFDGWAEDTTKPGEYKDYYFPNGQSGRMMWYHDHAVHIVSPIPREYAPD